MPVRQMTEEERARFFGSGFVIFGMKRPAREQHSSYADESNYEHVSRSSAIESRRDQIRGKETPDSIPSNKQGVSTERSVDCSDRDMPPNATNVGLKDDVSIHFDELP